MYKFCTIISLLVLAGCPDPVESGNVTTTSTTKEDPASINGNGPTQMESDPNAARLNLKEGEGLTISGTFQYSGSATGSKRVDVQKFREGSAPSLVHTIEISDDNTFSFQVPPDYGKILVTGFIDKAGNGPTADDPQGRLSLEIGAEAQSNIILEVSDDYTPPAGSGNPGPTPPGQQQNPPSEGNPPPEGQQKGATPPTTQPGTVVPSPGQPGTQQETQNPPKEQDGPPADD